MYQRIMELLVLLMDEYGGSTLQIDRMDLISADLLRRGYTEQEINTALFWLHHRFGRKGSAPAIQPRDIQEPAPTSFRLLNPFERRCFSADAFGYLLHLMSHNLINQCEFEQVIERVLMLDLAPASLDDTKLVVQSVLFEDTSFGVGADKPFGPSNLGETYH